MHLKSISGVVAGAALASAQCAIPVAPLPASIAAPFRLEIQNTSRPDVHGKHMNIFEAGGGDQHLFIGPVGNLTHDFTLVDGVINWLPGGVRAVIGGEVLLRTPFGATLTDSARSSPRSTTPPSCS
jgi:kremen protein